MLPGVSPGFFVPGEQRLTAIKRVVAAVLYEASGRG
jgi:hypothetical protein